MSPQAVARRLPPFACGLTLLVAATLKLTSRAPDGLVPVAWMRYVIGAFECVLALGLLSAPRNRAVLHIGLFTFLVFGWFSMLASAKGARCGCFGDAVVDPRVVFLLDIACGTALLLRIHHERRTLAWPIPQCVIALSVVSMGVAATIVAWSSVPQNGWTATNSFQPQRWLGRPLPFVNEIKGLDSIRTGRWMVLFYHDDCAVCREAYKQMKALLPNGIDGTRRLAVVELPPIAEHPRADFLSVPHGMLTAEQWFIKTPLCVELEDGVIRRQVDLQPVAQ